MAIGEITDHLHSQKLILADFFTLFSWSKLEVKYGSISSLLTISTNSSSISLLLQVGGLFRFRGAGGHCSTTGILFSADVGVRQHNSSAPPSILSFLSFWIITPPWSAAIDDNGRGIWSLIAGRRTTSNKVRRRSRSVDISESFGMVRLNITIKERERERDLGGKRRIMFVWAWGERVFMWVEKLIFIYLFIFRK